MPTRLTFSTRALDIKFGASCLHEDYELRYLPSPFSSLTLWKCSRQGVVKTRESRLRTATCQVHACITTIDTISDRISHLATTIVHERYGFFFCLTNSVLSSSILAYSDSSGLELRLGSGSPSEQWRDRPGWLLHGGSAGESRPPCLSFAIVGFRARNSIPESSRMDATFLGGHGSVATYTQQWRLQLFDQRQMWFLGTLEGKFQKGHTQEGERLGGHIKVCPSQIFAEVYTPSQATGGEDHGQD